MDLVPDIIGFVTIRNDELSLRMNWEEATGFCTAGDESSRVGARLTFSILVAPRRALILDERRSCGLRLVDGGDLLRQ